MGDWDSSGDIVGDLQRAVKRFRRLSYEQFMQQQMRQVARLTHAATAPTPGPTGTARILEACGLDPNGIE